MEDTKPEETNVEEQKDEENKICPEKLEEAKLKSKYPHLGNKPGGSDLLRKRLQKGVRFIQCSLSAHIGRVNNCVIRGDPDHRALVVLHRQ
ncbi:cAMP-regulated phosphoprotein 19-like [Sinocyclocheilus grahami]|uniref:cAMP-regulated phosphoprotein 19-like n=1 Tax=Sinocyclocheilus grahami TaxID=75366 RepID=UPI0007ACB2F4|nr:PREDICTED: cAMP-regulated phosphoprotein 19-like [Sinocyclocheilus grahami]